MTEYERMEKGLLYDPADEEVLTEQMSYKDKLWEFNRLRPSQLDERDRLMHEMFAEQGLAFAERHVMTAMNIFANYNLTLVDDGHIYIGDWAQFGPNVTLATAGHPILPELREDPLLQYNKDIHIGRNVWIGAGTVVCPGVRIGENSVIGAGSIVTRDIPADVVAFGNPCRVIRKISRLDRETFFRGEKIDWKELKK